MIYRLLPWRERKMSPRFLPHSRCKGLELRVVQEWCQDTRKGHLQMVPQPRALQIMARTGLGTFSCHGGSWMWEIGPRQIFGWCCVAIEDGEANCLLLLLQRQAPGSAVTGFMRHVASALIRKQVSDRIRHAALFFKRSRVKDGHAVALGDLWAGCTTPCWTCDLRSRCTWWMRWARLPGCDQEAFQLFLSK